MASSASKPSARAVEMQQPARAALARGKLGDQLLRQLVIEIAETHLGDYMKTMI